MQVGNGDVTSVRAALELRAHSGCDGIMIGRGALQDPLLFVRIKQHFMQQAGGASAPITAAHGACGEVAAVESFLRNYASLGFDGRAGSSAALVSVHAGLPA